MFPSISRRRSIGPPCIQVWPPVCPCRRRPARQYANRDDIETQTGRYVDVRRPCAEDIDVRDIAHALSLQCRFNGHVREFYSVAEHCLRVADHLPKPLRVHGLLHDAAEAYLGDIVTPVKRRLFGFAGLENGMLRAIYVHLGVPWPSRKERALVKQADIRALREEAYGLLPSRGIWHIDSEPLMPERPLLCLAPYAARALWLQALGDELSQT